MVTFSTGPSPRCYACRRAGSTYPPFMNAPWLNSIYGLKSLGNLILGWFKTMQKKVFHKENTQEVPIGAKSLPWALYTMNIKF